MNSLVIKRSIVIAGHKTSVSLGHVSLTELIATIDGGRRDGNLSSAIRLFVLDHYRGRTADPGKAAGGRTTAPPLTN